MHLWYPIEPFGDVPLEARTRMNLKSSEQFMFWSSLERTNLTHFKTPINNIVLDEWISMGYAEVRNCLSLFIRFDSLYQTKIFEKIYN